MLKQEPNTEGKRYDADTHQWVDDAPVVPDTPPKPTPAAAAADQPAAEE